MTFSEIKELRKAGNLEEALNAANEAVLNNPNDIWMKRAKGWVLYDYMKKDSEELNADDYLVRLKDFSELQLPQEEAMLYNSLCWTIFKLIKKATEQNAQQVNKLCNSILDIIKPFPFTKPSDEYSILLKAFYKASKIQNGYDGFVDFTEWWNLDNLLQDDYKPYETQEGNRIMSIAESVYITVAKQLVAIRNNERIDAFLPKIEKLHEEHPEMVYPGYYIGLLYISSGASKDDVLKAFLPFARKKSRDFWVWQLLSEINVNDADKSLACLLFAYNCKTKPEFLVKIYERLAGMLIDRQRYAEAKTVLDKYIETKRHTNTRIHPQVNEWINSSFIIQAEKRNPNLILNYEDICNEILYADSTVITIVVTSINKEKGFFSFIYGNKKQAFGSYKGLKTKIIVGGIYSARFEEVSKGPVKINSISSSQDTPSPDFYRIIEGKIKINDQRTYGEISTTEIKAFTFPGLADSVGASTGDDVKAIVIYDYNKNKGNWQWKTLSLIKK